MNQTQRQVLWQLLFESQLQLHTSVFGHQHQLQQKLVAHIAWAPGPPLLIFAFGGPGMRRHVSIDAT